MKRMWIQLKEDCDRDKVARALSEIGRIEPSSTDPRRLILTFHNQSESGVKMSCFRLSEDFIGYFHDFDMIRD